ncbi:MAG: prolyl oligopeptidase family serine peptidase [Actinobacteria bacterium]|uniref:Unannotated protein n=1 Tax=freshwater metagenome TaxID=449393 RepID=A0A6J7QDQ8_9ZZZZ|nr:prolyl oligopeptidase family serine peptidase [Actinomycetota bacterium]
MALDGASDAEIIEWFEGILAAARDRYPCPTWAEVYGEHLDHVIDFWGERDQPLVVISIHGGYFAAHYDRGVNEPVCRAMASMGALVANVEYSRAGGCTDPMDSVRDVRAAVAHVVNSVRPGTRVVVTGHSAGGYLALAASTVPGIDAVVALAPVTDLWECSVGGWDDEEIARWIGVLPHESPDQWHRMRLENVGMGDVPCVVIHGATDGVVPLSQSEVFVAARGPETRLVALPGVGHYEFLDADSAATAALLAELGLPG